MKALRLLAAAAASAAWASAARPAAPEPPPGAAACSGCHASRPDVNTAVPRLAGRTAADIAAEMQAFKAGKRPATVMDRIARGLTDAEIEAIAAWYGKQK